MEKRDLYDSNRMLTGETIFKGQPIPKNRYINVVLSIIQNSKGEFLIQKRSKLKDGKYGFTGGHPKSGESSLDGMITEIKEEIGVEVPPKDLNLLISGKANSNHVFYDIYYLYNDFDISNLTLQEEEVESVEWLPAEKVDCLINDGLFLKSHSQEFYRALDIIKEKY